jgi:Ran GTPase-activating protein (RanGAP) involved in mRNA processing and transport
MINFLEILDFYCNLSYCKLVLILFLTILSVYTSLEKMCDNNIVNLSVDMMLDAMKFKLSRDQPTKLAELTKIMNVLNARAFTHTVLLTRNGIDAHCARVIANGLKTNISLVNLDLRFNCIGNQGVGHLALALERNTDLCLINLAYNLIGDEGARYLAASLKRNTSLQTLVLCDNEIGDAGARCIADVLERNTTLRGVSLAHCEIHNDGARRLATALEHNSTLSQIDLAFNPISEEMKAELQKAGSRGGIRVFVD